MHSDKKLLKQYLGVGEWKSINVSISGIQQLDEAETSYPENLYTCCVRLCEHEGF